MNIDDIPTPETIFRYEADKYTSGFSAYENMRDHARDLERRLTIAREALQSISKNAQPYGPFWYGGEIQTKVREALALTAPKP